MNVVDANVWISVAVADDAFHQPSVAWLRSARAASLELAGPTLVLAEVAGAIARRTGRRDAATETFRAFEEPDGIRLVSVDDDLVREAARLAADLGLRGADAIYVAYGGSAGLSARDMGRRDDPEDAGYHQGATAHGVAVGSGYPNRELSRDAGSGDPHPVLPRLPRTCRP